MRERSWRRLSTSWLFVVLVFRVKHLLSLYSMFVRMLLHNAMEEQKRQEVLDAEDEDDE